MDITRRDHLLSLVAAAGLLGLGKGALAAAVEAPPGVTPMKAFSAAEISLLRGAAGIPAMGAAFARDGGKPVLIADGLRSADAQVPVSADDLWHIGSNTKSMTSTLVARLVEQGKISWDMTVGDILGSAAPGMQESYRKANFRHLCSHHSGMTGGMLKGPIAATYSDKTGADLRADRLAVAVLALEETPVGAPGEKMVYSNAGYVTAAAMLETLHGQPWERLIAAHVFQPLNLGSAGFGPPGRPGRLDQPLGHAPAEEGGKIVPAVLGDPGKPAELPAVYGPAGLVHLSMADIVAYLNAHLLRPASFLKPESWDILHTPPFTGDYAMGWLLRHGGIWHNGSNGRWYGETFIDHKRRVVACAMSNNGHLDKAAPAVAELLRTAISAAV